MDPVAHRLHQLRPRVGDARPLRAGACTGPGRQVLAGTAEPSVDGHVHGPAGPLGAVAGVLRRRPRQPCHVRRLGQAQAGQQVGTRRSSLVVAAAALSAGAALLRVLCHRTGHLSGSAAAAVRASTMSASC